jgi:hypothetical protein
MAHTDNAAGRLHDVLSRFKNRASEQSKSRAHNVWRDALGLQTGGSFAVYAEMPRIAKLPDLAERELRRVVNEGDDLDMLLRWRSDVDVVINTFFSSPTAPAANSATLLTDTVMQSLQYAARELHRLAPEPAVDPERGELARQAIDDLLAALHEDDTLDPDARELLLRHAAALQHALALAWVIGVEAVEDALTAFLGAVATATVRTTNDARSSSPVWARVAAVVGALSDTLTLAQGVVLLGAPVVAGLISS